MTHVPCIMGVTLTVSDLKAPCSRSSGLSRTLLVAFIPGHVSPGRLEEHVLCTTLPLSCACVLRYMSTRCDWCTPVKARMMQLLH